MNWKSVRDPNGKPSQTAIRSDCGEYTVEKVDIDCYVASHRGRALTVACEPDLAKQRCEEHAAHIPELHWPQPQEATR